MTTHARSLVLLAAAAPATLIAAPASPASHAPVLAPARPAPTVHAADHGRLAWFGGTFDAALAEARSRKSLVFMDFWADWCGWCKRLDQDTFSDAAVVDEMKDLVCVSIDKESETGGPIARRYGVGGLPTLVFADGNGDVVDVIVGYLPPEPFRERVQRIKRGEGTLPALRKEVEARPDDVFARFDLAAKLHSFQSPDYSREMARVRALLDAGKGFDPEDIDQQWDIAQRFNALRDRAGYQRHLNAIRKLDPERRSLPMRREVFEGIKREIDTGYRTTGKLDVQPLIAFLGSEQHEELLFEGWILVRNLHAHQGEEARRRGSVEIQEREAVGKRRAEREAWAHCPPDQVAAFGHDLAWAWYLVSADLTDEEMAFAVDVARKSVAAAPGSAKHLDTLACCLFEAGRTDEAVANVRAALEIEPANELYRGHLKEFQEGS